MLSRLGEEFFANACFSSSVSTSAQVVTEAATSLAVRRGGDVTSAMRKAGSTVTRHPQARSVEPYPTQVSGEVVIATRSRDWRIPLAGRKTADLLSQGRGNPADQPLGAARRRRLVLSWSLGYWGGEQRTRGTSGEMPGIIFEHVHDRA
jgi:hypothetical protein